MRPTKYILSFTTVVISAIAIAACGGSGSSSSSARAASSASSSAVKAVAAPAPLTQSVTLLVKSDTEKARRGPDGQWHDAFLPGGFAVKAGATVKSVGDGAQRLYARNREGDGVALAV